MIRRRREWPTTDELVLCTVTKVFAQGAFAGLDEYGGKRGMIHISEVASGWIKNIRDHVREGQKAVCKVLAVDERKGHVDLSLRRVKEGQRRWKVEQWKREQRAEKLLELVARKLGKTLDTAYAEVGFALQDEFGDLYSAFESVAKGEKVLPKLGIKEPWAGALTEASASIAAPPSFKVVGYLDLSCPGPDGVEKLRAAMVNARDSVKGGEVGVEIYYVGSPRYRVEAVAPSYKQAEAAIQRMAELAIGAVKGAGGSGEFHVAKRAGK